MKLRIKFAKTGVMKFIGHLDIMRYFQKAIRRAEIDIAYSGGFSPHQIMSFAAPLGVGIQSKGDYFDIEVHSITSCQDIRQRLQAEMVEGMEILDVVELSEHSGNAMASVRAAAYRIMADKKECGTDWVSLFEEFISPASIIATKKTKKSEKEIDIKEFIYQVEIQEQAVVLLVNASSSGNISPGFIMQIFAEKNAVLLKNTGWDITRLELYGDKELNGSQTLVPLAEL
mgnify:CR=1 FL=1